MIFITSNELARRISAASIIWLMQSMTWEPLASQAASDTVPPKKMKSATEQEYVSTVSSSSLEKSAFKN